MRCLPFGRLGRASAILASAGEKGEKEMAVGEVIGLTIDVRGVGDEGRAKA